MVNNSREWKPSFEKCTHVISWYLFMQQANQIFLIELYKTVTCAGDDELSQYFGVNQIYAYIGYFKVFPHLLELYETLKCA